MGFHCEIENKDDNTLVHLEGDLDLYHAEMFRNDIKQAIDSGARKIIMIFDWITYIDSSGIGSIVACLQHMRKVKGNICLAGLRDTPLQVFALTNIDRLFKIYPDTDSALAASKEENA